MKSLALLVAIYGRGAIAALPDSCQAGDITSCDDCTPLNQLYEPPKVGEVWYSVCCPKSETDSSTGNTVTKQYCYSYKLSGYPNNLHAGTLPSTCGTGTTAWALEGQCRTTNAGTAAPPYKELQDNGIGCPGQYNSAFDYSAGDTVEDNGVVYTCQNDAFCDIYGPDLTGIGEEYWKATNSCDGTASPTQAPTYATVNAGCPAEIDASTEYEANDKVSVTRDDGVSIIYQCKPFPQSQFCNLPLYSPKSTEKQCNGDLCWSEAWNKLGACEGTYAPTGTPTFDPANLSGCPEEFTASTPYEAGDKISVTPQGEDYGKIYQCKPWPASGNCVKGAYSPSNIDPSRPDLWKEAWIYIGGCYGTISPTGTPTFDPANVSGCPEEFTAGTEYEPGDKVSVTPQGEDYGKIYQCKSWPAGAHCGQDGYSPANIDSMWKDAWTYVGGCYGTIAPTGTPTFDPANLNGCPEAFDSTVTYEAGDKVSVTPQGEDYGKIYKCKPWPNNARCNQDGYSPADDEPEQWSQAWTYEGGCYGTISPTQAPTFTAGNLWANGGCPEEYAPNSGYIGGDYVTISKNAAGTLGIVWKCKIGQTEKWCDAEGYAPGTDYAHLAWEKVGHCDGTLSPTTAPTPFTGLCQYKKILPNSSNGEYVVLQADSWKKNGDTVSTTGVALQLYGEGDLVRYGDDTSVCSGWPYTPYCLVWSPFKQDGSAYNSMLSNLGWPTVSTCQDVASQGDTTGSEDEFDPATGGPVFAANGNMLVTAAGDCVNDGLNPEDYFNPGVAGCSLFAPSTEPSSAPSLSGMPSSMPSDVPSSMPSDVPSMVPSSMPSDVPSMVPSSMPSDVPSSMPSDVPSSEPSVSLKPTQ